MAGESIHRGGKKKARRQLATGFKACSRLQGPFGHGSKGRDTAEKKEGRSLWPAGQKRSAGGGDQWGAIGRHRGMAEKGKSDVARNLRVKRGQRRGELLLPK